MRNRTLNVAGQTYIFKRYVTEKERDLFKTHFMAKGYHFKTLGRQIAFYVKNSTISSSKMSKYHKKYSERMYHQ